MNPKGMYSLEELMNPEVGNMDEMQKKKKKKKEPWIGLVRRPKYNNAW